MEKFVDGVFKLHHVGIWSLVGREGLFGVVEHTCAEAHTSVVSLKDVVVLASLATLPELIIVGEFGEGDRFVAHFGIELHDRQRSSDREKFRERTSESSQLESFRLDGAGKAKMAVFWVDNQSGCSYEVAMTPAFNVAEPYQAIAMECHHAFTARDFLSDIFGGSFGDTCAALKG